MALEKLNGFIISFFLKQVSFVFLRVFNVWKLKRYKSASITQNYKKLRVGINGKEGKLYQFNKKTRCLQSQSYYFRFFRKTSYIIEAMKIISKLFHGYFKSFQ